MICSPRGFHAVLMSGASFLLIFMALTRENTINFDRARTNQNTIAQQFYITFLT